MNPTLIPYPQKLSPLAGSLALSRKSPLTFPGGMEEVGAFVSRRMKGILGWSPAKAGAGPGIRLVIAAEPDWAAEEFEFLATPAGLLIRARTREGLLLGCQTLLQYCLPFRNKAVLRIPAVRIHDLPRYAWRGILLDTCRHFFSVASLKRTIDLLSLHKFNRLHWHLTEDQGWRLQIKKYPRLAKVAAWRRKVGEKKPYGGFYSHAQVRDVVAYAHAAGMVVVPEIEMPGHSTAALAAYPELSCRGGKFVVRTEWGIHSDIYCAGNDKTFEFLRGVLDEVAGLFPSPWIHLGADEAPKTRWKACPKCQARIKKEKLKDEYALQTWFVKRMADYLKKKGRTVVAWDEILEGGAPEGSIVQNWRDFGPKGYSAKAAKAGRDTLVSPWTHWYLDHTNMGLKKTWSLDPMPAGLSRAEQGRVLGGEACAWSEGITEESLDERLFPRAFAVSERLWRGWQGGKGYGEFKARAGRQVGLLKRLGVKHSERDLKG